MQKNLQKIFDRLIALKNGMVINALKWVGQPVDTADVDVATAAITAKDGEIETSKDALSTKRAEGRTVVETQTDLADQIENLALGIHQSDKEKLVQYNIKERKTPEPKDPPGQAVIASVKTDSDGVGFVIAIQPLVDAEDFDIERAETDAAVMVATEFKHIKTTKKLTYVDDDVVSGRRYHYRVIPFNRRGSGPASAVISAIQ